MSTTWFTSDLHINDPHHIDWSKRYCFDDYQDMVEALVANWNACVADDDEVWVLGDFVDDSVDVFVETNARLKGRKHYLRGNHDPGAVFLPEKAARLLPSATVHDCEGLHLSVEGRRILVSHRPFACWPTSALHLHGHRHGGWTPRTHGDYRRAVDRIDVGVDVTAWEFSPVSFEMVLAHLQDGISCDFDSDERPGPEDQDRRRTAPRGRGADRR